MKTQDPNEQKTNLNEQNELSQQEQQETNGGGLLGGDSNTLTGITQGYLNVSHTDEDGDTNSLNTDFGTGSIFDSKND